MQFENGDIVIVTALNQSKIFRHHAVYLDGLMYHFNETGAHTDTPQGLIERSGRKVIRVLHGTQTPKQMRAYAEKAKNRTYNALFFNCEHYAYAMATGTKQSPTIRGAVVAVITAAALVISGILTHKQYKK